MAIKLVLGWAVLAVPVLAEDAMSSKLEVLLMTKTQLLQTKLDQVQIQMSAGRASAAELRDAKVALFNAQLAVVTNAADRMKVHDNLVLTHEEYCQVVEEKARSGVARQLDLVDARLAVLQAKIDRERDMPKGSGIGTDTGKAQPESGHVRK